MICGESAKIIQFLLQFGNRVIEWWIDRKTQRENSRNELQEGKLYYIVEKNYIKNEDEFRDGLRELLGMQRPNSWA